DNADGEVVAGRGDLLRPAHAEPLAEEDGVLLELEELVRRIARRWQRLRPADVNIGGVERGERDRASAHAGPRPRSQTIFLRTAGISHQSVHVAELQA